MLEYLGWSVFCSLLALLLLLEEEDEEVDIFARRVYIVIGSGFFWHELYHLRHDRTKQV